MSGDFLIGDWRVQPAVNRLTRGDQVVRLEPKLMQVLVCLASAGGEVVTREDLIARVWPGVFVTDDVLHRAIRELRRVFGDSSSAPAYIETIRKRGYRLMVDAEQPESATSVGAVGSVSAGDSRPRWSFLALAGAVGLACALAVVALVSRPGGLATEAHARFVPVVSGPLNESDPAISPDGARIAFVQREAGDTSSADIYVRTLADGQTRRLTMSMDSDRMPAWSPDGQRLAFVRMTPFGCDLFMHAVSSGTEERVAECGNREDPRVAWTADARALLTSHAPTPFAHAGWRIVRIALDTAALTPVTSPPLGIVGDHSPSVSPDGREVAFIRRTSGGVSDVYVAPISGGSARRLTFDEADLTGLDWAGDGQSLIYSSDRAGGYSLWRVAADGRKPTLVAGGAARMKHPVADRAGHRVVYENWNYEINIWQTAVGASAGQTAGEARSIVRTSELWNLYPQISPNGAQLAYVSTQSGSHELWVADRGGGQTRQLTRLGRGVVTSPRWSPDGRRLAYLARRSGGVDVHAIDVATGVSTALTSTPGTEVAPSWSHDGEQVYYGAPDSAGGWSVWRVAASGDRATPERVIADAVSAQVSPDGSAIYFTRSGTRGLWRATVGELERARVVVDAIAAGSTASWSVTSGGVYFTEETDDVVRLRQLPSSHARDAGSGPGNVVTVATLTQLSWPGFSVSPDGAHVVYARWDRRESNIMSIELER